MEASLKKSLLPKRALNLPGSSHRARVLLPVRLLVVAGLWSLSYPLLLVVSVMRALYLRLVKGRPSQILRHGRHNASHRQGLHYPCIQTYTEPLDEARLRKALIGLCAEDGMGEGDVYLKFHSEEPNDWPSTGSWDCDHFIESHKRPGARGRNHIDFMDESSERGEPAALLKMHVWNGPAGKPTVVFFFGSANRWDGSSNFNFVKELVNRYMGNPPNQVFKEPEISAASADEFDRGSFLRFILQMPFAIAKTTFLTLWQVVRAARWAGGNGIKAQCTAMNFTKEESQRLYSGAKALGIKPFAAFTYATVKACEEVLGERPWSITNQASLQTRHYPVPGQTHGDLVGDWLVGPVQAVPQEFGIKEAMAAYDELQAELDAVGPIVRESIMAKAYGVLNSGAALFQMLPTYAAWRHPIPRCIFMNNYGIRTMPPGSPFNTWNWNAPLWLGVNTINVDGATTTLVGSSFWGLDVVEAVRDHIEATLREMMSNAGPDLASIPAYRKPGQQASTSTLDGA